ncbi:hypothetical protein BDQ12DRAFT_481404 [Crucibulum laeve]|uniref:Ankyrin repeat-containing domain protein n=1 Tax=Crucibulum laeve TaxID=68775 RepID=A0A5C3M5X7_9AGAR|nr:hypothetical protein BDQ12DRAFT_481404 [Crucibulum laeve]
MSTEAERTGLHSLPVELLYEIQLYALSKDLPYTSQHIRDVFISASPRYRAQYLLERAKTSNSISRSDIFSRVLRYGLCSKDVIEALIPMLLDDPLSISSQRYELPRRLFRRLAPKTSSDQWKDHDEPLPFLQYLFTIPDIPTPYIDSHDGYALTKAVHARFVPLIQYLLGQGASPARKHALAVTVAIRKKDLELVKLLVERRDPVLVTKKGKAKKRKLHDRLDVTPAMLKTAVKCDARDIVDYLIQEKGVIPDMQTLQMLLG